MSSDVAVAVHGLSVEYDGAAVLHAVDLEIRTGEVVALLGPSGSGKSTLLHAVAGFRQPSAGTVRLGGRLVASASASHPPERRDVAVVFQGYALWPHMTAVDTVAYPLRRSGRRRAEARAEALTILERLGVGQLADRRPAELSGGEQQRVGLARALARHASVYLFDEPTAHLDTHVRGVFLEEMFDRRRDRDAAVLYATHDAEEALGLADRVALLNAGRLVQVGTPQEVYDEPVDLWAARLTGPASVVTSPHGVGRVLVRPGWAGLGGPLSGVIRAAWFRGPHSDYLVESPLGRLVIRAEGPARYRAGDEVAWSLDRFWVIGDEGTTTSRDLEVEPESPETRLSRPASGRATGSSGR